MAWSKAISIVFGSTVGRRKSSARKGIEGA
jgi:hypothetical protein